jgi:putative salt-induced outer membrane protein YdiY
VGYDDVREIDLQYQASPGIGYHLVQKSRFIADLIVGGSFQRQIFEDHRDQTRYSMRITEKMEWQLSDKVELEEKLDFYPDIEDFGEFNLRFEAKVQYALKEYLTLNLTVIDIYDSQVPSGVNNNDLQIRSSLGVAF